MCRQLKVLAAIVFLVFLAAGCGSHFGVANKATFAPGEFQMTEQAIAKAEASAGAKYCPEKIAQAKALAREGAEIYWACRTAEAMDKLAQARKLAQEAELCQPPPPPPPPPKPQAKPAPPPPPPLKRIATLGETHFAFDSYQLKPEGKVILDEAVKVMMQRPDIKLVEVAGHTDHIGTVAYNQVLSEKRAQSVKDYMVSKGISASRLKAVGYGKSRPIATNTTKEGRAKNRRVELNVVE